MSRRGESPAAGTAAPLLAGVAGVGPAAAHEATTTATIRRVTRRSIVASRDGSMTSTDGSITTTLAARAYTHASNTGEGVGRRADYSVASNAVSDSSTAVSASSSSAFVVVSGGAIIATLNLPKV